MVEARVASELHHCYDGSGFRVAAPKHQRLDAGVYQCASTHWARFERHIQSAAVESPVTGDLGRLPQGLYFGVGGRILQHLPLISTGRDQGVMFIDDDASDRDIAMLSRQVRLRESEKHPVFV